MPFVFLEFDAATAASDGVPLPSVFISLDWPAAVTGATRFVMPTVGDALSLLVGPHHAEAPVAAVGRCVATLPAAGHLLHVGVMLGRDAAIARLSVALPRVDLRRHLAAIGYPGDAERVAHVLRDIEPEAERVHLEYDAGAAVGARLGVVLAGANADLRHRAMVLARLQARALCTDEAAAGVLSWPGTSAGGALAGRPVPLRRAISHLKLVLSPADRSEAKAYLTASLVPSTDDVAGRVPH